jgi:mono/diheme cytochrome c family protein
MTGAELLARGEYMVRMGGCNDCHTPGWNDSAGQLPTDRWLTGSPLGNKGPWGTTYPANLRLKVAGMDEATWMGYTANLHTRPLMPDFAVRAMHDEDRRAIYRFIRSLGPAGQPAPAYLPPGQDPSPPYLELVLPPPPPAGH